jgi:hypothetical protein
MICINESEREIYKQLEIMIVRWNNDGTKTAGTLTREILEKLNVKIKNNNPEDIL